MTENPFLNACAAIKDGKIVKAWRSWPDGYDADGLDFDYIRPLTLPEVMSYMPSATTQTQSAQPLVLADKEA